MATNNTNSKDNKARKTNTNTAKAATVKKSTTDRARWEGIKAVSKAVNEEHKSATAIVRDLFEVATTTPAALSDIAYILGRKPEEVVNDKDTRRAYLQAVRKVADYVTADKKPATRCNMGGGVYMYTTETPATVSALYARPLLNKLRGRKAATVALNTYYDKAGNIIEEATALALIDKAATAAKEERDHLKAARLAYRKGLATEEADKAQK